MSSEMAARLVWGQGTTSFDGSVAFSPRTRSRSRVKIIYTVLLLYLDLSCKIFRELNNNTTLKGADCMDVWGFIQTPMLGRKSWQNYQGYVAREKPAMYQSGKICHLRKKGSVTLCLLSWGTAAVHVRWGALLTKRVPRGTAAVPETLNSHIGPRGAGGNRLRCVCVCVFARVRSLSLTRSSCDCVRSCVRSFVLVQFLVQKRKLLDGDCIDWRGGFGESVVVSPSLRFSRPVAGMER